jgi:hypothetical protein
MNRGISDFPLCSDYSRHVSGGQEGEIEEFCPPAFLKSPPEIGRKNLHATLLELPFTSYQDHDFIDRESERQFQASEKIFRRVAPNTGYTPSKVPEISFFLII